MDNAEVEDYMQWFRWWNDGVDDLKLLRLSYQHRWLWLVLLTMASKSPKRGYLYASEKMPCTEEDVAQVARLPINITQAGLRLFASEQFSMLTVDEQGAFKVVNWDKRQPSKDDVTARVAKTRMKHREGVTCNTPVTPPDYRVQNTDIDTPPISPKRGKRTTVVTEDGRKLAQELYDWLKSCGALPAAKGWFMGQAGVATSVLLTEHPLDEWLACLEWAKRDSYWSVNLNDLRKLGSKVWSQYARRGPALLKNDYRAANSASVVSSGADILERMQRIKAGGTGGNTVQ